METATNKRKVQALRLQETLLTWRYATWLEEKVRPCADTEFFGFATQNAVEPQEKFLEHAQRAFWRVRSILEHFVQ